MKTFWGDIWDLFMAFRTEIALGALAVGVVSLLIWHSRHSFESRPEIVIIDGCQYLRFPSLYSFGYTHKGNCTNRIHQNNQ